MIPVLGMPRSRGAMGPGHDPLLPQPHRPLRGWHGAETGPRAPYGDPWPGPVPGCTAPGGECYP